MLCPQICSSHIHKPRFGPDTNANTVSYVFVVDCTYLYQYIVVPSEVALCLPECENTENTLQKIHMDLHDGLSAPVQAVTGKKGI